MKSVGGEHVIDVIAPILAMVKIEGLVGFFAMLTLVLTVVQAMKSELFEKRDKIAKLEPARRSIKYKV